MNRMFDFEPAAYASRFTSQGYVHIPSAVTPAFHEMLQREVEASLAGRRLREFALGDKQQALYEFPAGADYLSELFEAVAAVCGLQRGEIVLAERHIKAYDGDAGETPLAHKDRSASQVAVGLAIVVPPGSRLVLYPWDDVGANPFGSSAELRASLGTERTPESMLARARHVEIEDRPRDVVMFRGSALWHYRARPAGATMLYLKLNDFNCDPLGEDPGTPALRCRTKALAAEPDACFGRAVAVLGRRVDRVERRYAPGWREVLAVVLWGGPALTIDEPELEALRAMQQRRTVAEVVLHMRPLAPTEAMARLRRLARAGVVDLHPTDEALTSPRAVSA